MSNSGADTNSGSLARPVRSLGRALQVAPAGGTIVLRRGVFHEGVAVNKTVTIQNYPGESVWIDGSVPIAGWTKVGTVWRHDGWTPRFDASPTYTKGAADGSSPGWGFVNPAYPMAAHPDMVFRDGISQRQVKTLALVQPGTFYLDTASSSLYVGSDPTRSAMRGTDIAKAMSVHAPGVLLRGFGMRRFGSSVWHMGAITLEAPRISLANITIDQMATTGISALNSDITLNQVTITRSGMLGMHASMADRLRVLRSLVRGNNTEHFNNAPVSGGIKVSRMRTVTVSESSITGNNGPGFWADESTYDIRALKNNITANHGHGISLEISARAVVADNLILNNAGNGVKVNNISNVRIWNNTVVGNARELNLVQDGRLAANTRCCRDPRQVYPDPTMTWLLGQIEVKNNVIGGTKSGNCLLCVEDYTHTRTAKQIGVTTAANLYNRPTVSPQWTHVWSNGAGNPAVYTSVARFRSATSQDNRSVSYDGVTVVGSGGSLTTTARAAANSAAVSLPSDIAALTDRPAGARWLGVWGR